jgi:polyisoprenoid-binding protein YceI
MLMISRLHFSHLVFIGTIMLIAGVVMASQPCTIFEGGRVDAQHLRIMRDAAEDGRLYRVDPDRSKVGFCVRHFPFQEFRGDFTNLVGGLAVPPGHQQDGQALLLIQTTSLESDNIDMMPMVQGRHFIDSQRYPEILFVGRAVHLDNQERGHVHGELTLHGVTQPVVFEISLRVLENGENNRPDRIYMKGKGEVNRFEFDMNSYRYFVSDSVRLCLSVEMVPWER